MPLKRIESLKDYPGAFVSPKQCADYQGVTTKVIHNAIKKGTLPARKFSKRVTRILITDYRRYIGSTGD